MTSAGWESSTGWRESLEWLLKLPHLPYDRPVAFGSAEIRAALERFLERLPDGLQAAVGRYGAELLALAPLSGSDSEPESDGDR